MFRNRLTKQLRHLSKLARRQQISCYRLYDRDLPEFPLIIDVYEDKLYVAEYRAHHSLSEEEYEEWLEQSLLIAGTVTGVEQEKIFVKQRQRKAGRLGQYQKTGDVKTFFDVMEGGLKFRVNLTDYLDTGLFLDHRVTREMVRKESADKNVLNLFCYTASFSVYAAAGGASKVTSVDLSNTYLNWSRENFLLNGFNDPTRYEFVPADVLQYLDELKISSYDIIVLDPPTFSNSKKMIDFLDVQRDHVDMINKCMQILKPGGVLYFSTNYRKFHLETELINASVIKDITKQTTPFDFEGKLLRYCYRISKNS
ncbi:MAG: class I SAM-dependent methyltransferase [Gemmatimonadaceae bacterium]|nr:class I SAM-dependent methyltransferase [Chitinophagaceae bacterium]